jgi:hypothetical protein
MTIQMALAVAFNVAMAATLIFALVCGGRPERIGALINLGGFVLTVLVRLLVPAAWTPAEVAVLLIDVAVAAGFYWLALTTIRFWPIWAAGFAFADLFMSIAGALLPHTPLFAYQSGLVIYAYLALGALALGTLGLPRDAEPHIRNGSRRAWIRHLKETS